MERLSQEGSKASKRFYKKRAKQMIKAIKKESREKNRDPEHVYEQDKVYE